MELEKRKREEDGGANGKRGKVMEDRGGVEVVAPPDEEVEEFFAILKRIQVAVKYFQKRNGGRCIDRDSTARPWRPSFEREDFEAVEKEPESESSEENQNVGLDLNSDPDSDGSSLINKV